MNQWIDFRELREKLDCEELLRLYGVEIIRRGPQHQGPCPLPGHRGQGNSSAFSVNLARGIFKCFGCHAQGNLLDFAVLMEGKNPQNGAEVRGVARKLAEHFGIGTPKVEAAKADRPKESKALPPAREERVNHPLDFELKGLDQDHPWFADQGIGPETVRYFGLGVAQRGSLKGKLAVPLHDDAGRLLGYASATLEAASDRFGRIPWEFPAVREHDGVRYRFDPDAVVYNLNRRPMGYDRTVVTRSLEVVWWLHEERALHVLCLLGASTTIPHVDESASLAGGLTNQVLVTFDEEPASSLEICTLGAMAEAGWVRWLRLRRAQGIPANGKKLLGIDTRSSKGDQ